MSVFRSSTCGFNRLSGPIKPLEEHRLDGTSWNARTQSRFPKNAFKESQGELVDPLEEVKPPRELNYAENELWKAIISFKADLGNLHPTDAITILAYIEAELDYIRISQMVREADFLQISSKGTLRAHPLLIFLDRMDKRRLTWLEHLCLTPLARIKLKAMQVELVVAEADPFEGFDEEGIA